MVAILTNQISRTGKRLIRTLQVYKSLMARRGGGRWRPMRSRHGNHFDQSDYEDRKTPNFDLAMAKNPDGLIGVMSVVANQASSW